jgi:hypothetical protein
VVSIVPVLSWVAALAGAAIAVAGGPRPVVRGFILDRLLRYAFIFPVGLMGLWGALGHCLSSKSGAGDRVADEPF